MSGTIQTLEDIRPPLAPLDPQWSTETLATILAEPARRPAPRLRHRVRAFAVFGVVAAALVLVLAPALVGRDSAPLGASASAAELLDRGAVAFGKQAPASNEYLHITNVRKTWVNGTSQQVNWAYQTWVPGDRERPMVEQTWDDGKFAGVTEIGLGGPDAEFYDSYPKEPAAMLDALNERAIESDSDSGDRGKNIWDQSFRELQGAEVPSGLKAAILKALTELPGVDARPAAGQPGPVVEPVFDHLPDVAATSLHGTALVFRDDPLAIVIDESSGSFQGMSYGIDNPPEGDTQWTWEFFAEVVPSAPAVEPPS